MDVIDKITRHATQYIIWQLYNFNNRNCPYNKLIISGFVIVYDISIQALSLTQMRDERPPLPPKAAPPVPPPRRHKVAIFLKNRALLEKDERTQLKHWYCRWAVIEWARALGLRQWQSNATLSTARSPWCTRKRCRWTTAWRLRTVRRSRRTCRSWRRPATWAACHTCRRARITRLHLLRRRRPTRWDISTRGGAGRVTRCRDLTYRLIWCR